MTTELIILDLYGTLVKADENDGIARPGFEEFWQHYQNTSLFVLSTDDSEEGAINTLKKARLYTKFAELYCAEHIRNISERKLKDLGQILTETGIPTEKAVFIGDNFYGKDEASAKAFEIEFIKIPQFRDKLPPNIFSQEEWVKYEDPKNPFNFKSLIGKI